ncbi:hypothetical protein CEXT_382831 [Caerostris extrusa]|uniref:Uncharacterized protein n=1 Tax=Caerostris extrusa TaxID=172846 RepID=A0AAV4M5Y2_CAEEX|nr:hypothetical protein CEXT_382831 [Caerostris extrusa]
MTWQVVRKHAISIRGVEAEEAPSRLLPVPKSEAAAYISSFSDSRRAGSQTNRLSYTWLDNRDIYSFLGLSGDFWRTAAPKENYSRE